MDFIQFVELGFILLFILISGFFSGSETSLMSVNKVKIRHDTQKGVEKAKYVDLLLKSPTKLLTTILVGNNLVNIAGSAIATTLALELFGANGPLIATLSMTILVLLFGEITPKSYASQNAEKVAYWSAPYLLFLSKLFSPIIKILVGVTGQIVKLLGGDQEKGKPFITEDEIIRFISVGEVEGLIEEEEKEMIHSIFEFDDTVVREVMVPRIDIASVDRESTIEDIVEIIIKNGHSRIPVFRETIDNITGIIYAKDLLQFVKKDLKDADIDELLRPAYYVPESKKVNQLFREMKNGKIHMAIVLDEYGGTAGIVTIEDLIEEIVGDIQDEYDFEDVDYNFITEQELMVDAKMPVDELNDLLDIALPEDDYDTLGGLILNHLGYVPNIGEEIVFDKIRIKIEEMSNHRILKLHIYILSDKIFSEIEEDRGNV